MERKNRRTRFLINPKFQLRFTFYMCSWICALAIFYPMIVSSMFDFIMRVAQGSPSGPPVERLTAAKTEVLILLVAMQIVLIMIVGLLGIFLSHRIAGPIFKLRAFMKEVEEGRLDKRLSFRSYDHFPELAQDYNTMVEAIKGSIEKKGNAISKSIASLEAAIESTRKDAPEAVRQQLESTLAVLKDAT